MKKLFLIVLTGFTLGMYSCSDDDFPVPPASTVAKFTAAISNDEYAPATVTFTNTSIVPERAGTVTYQWSFGDGTSSSEKDPVHDYALPGAYSVSLVIVTSSSMEIVETTSTILIKDPNATGIPVFFTDGSTVYTALINDQAPIAASIGITTLQDSYGMAIDTANDKLYISDFDAGKIYVANLDGSDMTTFRQDIGEPDGVAIDYVDNMLYWDTSSGIRRASLASTDVNQYEDFITGQNNDPEGLSIDLENRMLYWNNYDGGVWRKSLSSATPESQIVTTGGGGSVLVVGSRIFFDDYVASGDIRLKSADLNGANVATVATNITRIVYGLAYEADAEKIYWVDRNAGKIMRANTDGSSPEPWYTNTGISPRGVVIGKMTE